MDHMVQGGACGTKKLAFTMDKDPRALLRSRLGKAEKTGIYSRLVSLGPA